jgi:predicted kinase
LRVNGTPVFFSLEPIPLTLTPLTDSGIKSATRKPIEALLERQLRQAMQRKEILVTELTRLQRRLLKLIGLPAKDYGR